MQRIPVESSDIVAIGYSPHERVLEIEFKQGRVYQYLDVEPQMYEQFLRAESHGEYFYSAINKHYRYKRVQGDDKKSDDSDKLVLVTGNADKLRDLQAVCVPFGVEVEARGLPVDEIQSHDAEKIAVHKAKQAYKLAQRPVVVQDTFWNILALRGFPGAYMRYVSEWLRPEDFLALMQDKTDRTIIRTHKVVYCDGKVTKVFSKDFMGTLALGPRGKGVAIDQLVISAGQTRTNAEIREAEGRSPIPPDQSAWHDFAKWYNVRRRMTRA